MSLHRADRPTRLRPVLAVLAVVFAAWTIQYSICWMIAVRPAVPVELGFDAPTFLVAEHGLLVRLVRNGSPAEEAGLRAGDRIVAIDSRPLENSDSQVTEWSKHQPGDSVRLTILRQGAPAPIELVGVFRRSSGTGEGYLADQLRYWYPIPFIAIGLTVLCLRLEDRNAWLLALLFASFTTTSSPPNEFRLLPAFLRSASAAYYALFLGLVGPLFYWFFAVFPARSPFDRRMPWLKWLAVVLGLGIAAASIAHGRARLELPAALATALHDPGSDRIPFWYELSGLMLGLLSLVANFISRRDSETRRRIRVIFWGTIVAVTPPVARLAVENGFHRAAPPWINTLNSALIFLFPLSFAYAVVKHRVLEIPVLLRRSARYLLVQRGFALSLSLATIAITLVFVFSVGPHLQPMIDVAGPSGIALGAVLGTVVLWGGLRVHRRVSERIDRAFFRSAYDARVILEDLAERARTAASRSELAALLEHHLREALKPDAIVVFLANGAGRLVATAGQLPDMPHDIAADHPMLRTLADSGQPWEVPPDLMAGDHAWPFPGLTFDCLVPIVGRDGRLAGLLALGSRLSEEPYSGEDKRLLATLASQAASALDNIRFAEELAERMERDRRAAHEMEIARQVQARLLPQAAPPMETVDCAAQCIQARSVGGDYYDFLDLDEGVGFALADVSGKGVHAALLSASLQAHVRSQAAVGPIDPGRMLRRLNDIIWKSTAPQHYATLFFGLYDDRSRRMRYVNCGHVPPMLVRRAGGVERLGTTAPVVGLFDQWQCSVCEVQIRPGDVLAIFSDGITEALHGDDEFGEVRLAECLAAQAIRPAGEIAASVLAAVQAFSAGEQSDDLTLVVLKGR